MFSGGPNYTKLKTNLRLALNRLKLLEKKKAELTQKARKEIADYISAGKPERARIRVEHIIREDFLVEAMEIVEMYCDLLLARFGLITQMKELDDGIAEAVASIIWVAPRLQADIQELKLVSDILTVKYGKPFAEAARSAAGDHKISEKLMHKMAIQAPSKLLVEKYLIEIAKIYNIEYEPDPQVMLDDKRDMGLDQFLIDLSDKNNLNGGGGGPGAPQVGFIGYPQPPALPDMPAPPIHKPFNYPPGGFGGGPGGYGGGAGGYGGGAGGYGGGPGGYGGGPGGFGGPPGGFSGPGGYGGPSGSGGSASAPVPFNYNIPPQPPNYEKKDLNINSDFLQEEMHSLPPAYSSLSPDDNLQNFNKPKPQPRSKFTPDLTKPPSNIDFPELPNVPNEDFPDDSKPNNKDTDEIDFDLISKRFEELKKKK